MKIGKRNKIDNKRDEGNNMHEIYSQMIWNQKLINTHSKYAKNFKFHLHMTNLAPPKKQKFKITRKNSTPTQNLKRDYLLVNSQNKAFFQNWNDELSNLGKFW